jgi:hypothetical protein
LIVEFSDIYAEAIGLFDDPAITQAFNNNHIQFFQIMYTYLQNAIPRFDNPSNIQDILSLASNPSGQTEVFTGDGITTNYVLTTTPVPNSFFEYTINNVEMDFTYDVVTNSITIPSAIPIGTEGIFQWYFAGEIVDTTNTLDNTARNILARLVVVCWAEKEKNFLLDIRRLLGDTDFKLDSAANSIRSKSSWYDTMREEVEKKMNKYAFNLRIKKFRNKGRF